jgi:hypothetical protein
MYHIDLYIGNFIYLVLQELYLILKYNHLYLLLTVHLVTLDWS